MPMFVKLRCVLAALRILLGCAMAIALPAEAGAAPFPDWRTHLANARALAENDAPAAYRAVQRLEAGIAGQAAPGDRIELLNVQARIESYIGLTNDSITHAEQALQLATQHGDRVGEAEACLSLLAGAENQARMETMLKAAIDSMTVLEDVDRPALVVELMLRTALVYRRIGNFDASVTLPMQMLEIAERADDPAALAYAHQGMALSLQQHGQPGEARHHYEDMARYARDADSRILQGQALLGLATADDDAGKHREAEPRIREALVHFRRAGVPFHEGNALIALADNLRRQYRYAAALAALDESTAIFERGGNKMALWRSLDARSRINLASKRIAAAAADAEQAHAVARAIGLSLYKSRSIRQLATLAAERSDWAQAYALGARAAEVADKADSEWGGKRALELAGRFKTESRQRQIKDLMHRNEQQALRQRWLATVLAGSVVTLALTAFFLLRLRNSHRKLASANASLHEAQDDLQRLNSNLELTMQSRTAELRQQARYLRTLIDMLPMRAWFKDSRSRYLVANQAHAQACGSTAEEIVGKSDHDLVPAAVAIAHHADDADVMATRERKTCEECWPDDDGSRWMETYKAAVVDEDGTVLGTVGVMRDISELKATEAARNAALDEARQLAKLRSDFLAQMNHELRTPLNGILGYAQVLQTTPLNEHQTACLAVIGQSGEHLLSLINDILDLARIDAGKYDLYPTDIGLQRFLQSVADIVRIRAEQKGLAFACETAPDLPHVVHVDERLLRQVLLNLLSNAVQFTERGGVTLRVAPAEPGRLRFSVEDTGPGIAPTQMDAIFHPFEQGGESRRLPGGTGLGLSISRQFARRMGTEIHVESRLGDGSRFWFDVDAPAGAAAGAECLPRHAAVGYRGPRRKILVMEDLGDSRALLVHMLEPLGFIVAQAADGEEGIRLAQTFRPDLVLVDAVMPRMDGYRTTASLRRMPGFEKLPIIGLSASTSDLHRDNFLGMGADCFLPKPISLCNLLDRIAELLDIEWIFESEATPAPTHPLAPHASELRALHELALQGNMRDIVRHAAQIEAGDARFLAFADRLRQLAATYQSKAILNFVEQHLTRTETE